MVVHNRDTPTSPRTINITWLLPVINALTAPPANPNAGDRYRVLPSATGAWIGRDNSIAIYNGETNVWEFDTLTESQTWYDKTAQNWHYMSQSGVITQFDKIPLAESDVTGLVTDLANKAPLVHQVNHTTGGSDPFLVTETLDCIARVNLYLSGVLKSQRRGINLIAGANLAITESDNPASERCDITISASGTAVHPLLDGIVNDDTIAVTPVRGMIIYVDSTGKWNGFPIPTANKVYYSNGVDIVAATIQTILGYTPENVANKGVASGYVALNASNYAIDARGIAESQANKDINSGYAGLGSSGKPSGRWFALVI